jgi:hypothetical protein
MNPRYYARRESLRTSLAADNLECEGSNMSRPSTPKWPEDETGVPQIDGDECFGDLVDKLSW